MKIDIITLHRAENYGSVLQTLALQVKLEELGHKVRILDYYPERFTNKGLLKRLKQKSDKLRNPLLLLAAKILIYPSYLRKNQVFRDFINKYLHLDEAMFASNEEAVQRLTLDADAYCTGSDQVWNSHWNEGIEKALYLDFVPKGKLVFSYASSIGLSELPPTEIDETRSLLQKYEHISVREDAAIKIMQELGRKDAVQCLDPTLLMDKEEWNKYVEHREKQTDYILTYNLHHDSRIDRYAAELGKKHRLPVWNISYNWHDIIRKGHLCWCPSVERFLWLIKNARFVIADSFHATVFSILFERPFVTITPDIASSRISSILHTLGIEERNLNSFTDTSMIETPIDYKKVKEALKIEQNRSMDYLRMATNTEHFTHNQ